jgi:hypothetical protein
MAITFASVANDLGTKNELETDESYAHITVFQPISQSVIDIPNSWQSADMQRRVMMPDLRKLRDIIKPSKTDQGDGLCPQLFMNYS